MINVIWWTFGVSLLSVVRYINKDEDFTNIESLIFIFLFIAFDRLYNYQSK